MVSHTIIVYSIQIILAAFAFNTNGEFSCPNGFSITSFTLPTGYERIYNSSEGLFVVYTFLNTKNITFSTRVTGDILVVGGGGGGANGGGGGGQVVKNTLVNLAPGTYTATVGSGGIGSSNTYTCPTTTAWYMGANGGSSSWASVETNNVNLIAIGGGGGESVCCGITNSASRGRYTVSVGNGGGAGFDGGNVYPLYMQDKIITGGFLGGKTHLPGYGSAGGGGGAGAAGKNPTADGTQNANPGSFYQLYCGGVGGDGAKNSFRFGTDVFYGGGGGGATNTNNQNCLSSIPVGGQGGGGQGNIAKDTRGTAGTANSGGGGGGSDSSMAGGATTSGGSGIVVIRVRLCCAGQFKDNAGVCQDCPAGHYCPLQISNPLPCLENYYCPAKSSQPIPCPSNTGSAAFSVESFDCKCFRGFAQNMTCQSCPTGKFNAINGSSECSLCPSGTFNPNIGSSSCTVCAAGTYESLTGISTPCENCTAGTYSVSGASKCLQCDFGFTSSEAASVCTLIPTCPIGTYGTHPDCNPCPPNTNSSLNHTSTLLDCRCLPGYVCSYTKRINIRLTLKNITWDMLTIDGIANSPMIDAIALAAGVPRENVVVNGFFTGPSGRRMMREPPSHTLPSSTSTDFPTIWATILDATTFNDALATTLLDPYLVDSFSWTHGHSVRVAREWDSLI